MPVDPVSAAIVGSLLGLGVAFTPSPPPSPAGRVQPFPQPFPMEARRGMMLPPSNGKVSIDGKVFPLSPGAVLRDPFNRTIPAMVMDTPAWVHYQTDAMGAVHRVWILSPAEAALAAPPAP